MAVEMAGRMGAKICWFPTVDSQNEYDFLNRNQNVPLPYGAVADNKTLKMERLSVFKNGMLKSEVYDIIDIIKAHDMVLATGHLSNEEVLTLVKTASGRGLKKIVVTHGDYPATFMKTELQMECVKYGAFIEHNYLQIATGESSWEVALEQIRRIGAEHTIISSDGGQTTSIPPEEAVETYCRKLLESGFSEAEVRRIFVENTAGLVE